ncbi:MAG: ABC transporter ATP-binding protein [Bryobacteraceae bacterium]
MRYGAAEVLRDATLELSGPGLVSIVGPNGAGKSTLLGILSGLRRGYSGACGYDGVELERWNRRSLARRLSFVPQSLRLEFPFTAEQVVYMGRTPFCAGLFESPQDREAVERALRITDSVPFRDRDFRSLSGGERQRVILASALAQAPEALLLDEPTTFLDLKHQLAIYRLLRDLCRSGLLAIAATHDLNLALAYSDRVIVLAQGRVAADGAPHEVLAPETIRRVFGVEAQVRQDAGGKPRIFYDD